MWNLQSIAKKALALTAGLVVMSLPASTRAQGAFSGDSTVSHLLWASGSQASLWLVDSPTLNVPAYFTYTHPGYDPIGVASNEILGQRRMLWNSYYGGIALAAINGSYNETLFKQYNLGAGWIGRSVGVSFGPNITLNTYVLWRNDDGRISIWKLDKDLNIIGQKTYGPYSGWTVKHMAVNANGDIRLLWNHTSGMASIWKADANLNYVTSQAYGPFTSWVATSIAVNDSGRTRVLWSNNAGSASLWDVDVNLNTVDYREYSHGYGYGPSNVGMDNAGNTYVVWAKTDYFDHGPFTFMTAGQEVFIDKVYSSWFRKYGQYGPFDNWFVAYPEEHYTGPIR